MYSETPFIVYSLLSLYKCILSCDHHHNLIVEQFASRPNSFNFFVVNELRIF